MLLVAYEFSAAHDEDRTCLTFLVRPHWVVEPGVLLSETFLALPEKPTSETRRYKYK